MREVFKMIPKVSIKMLVKPFDSGDLSGAKHLEEKGEEEDDLFLLLPY